MPENIFTRYYHFFLYLLGFTTLLLAIAITLIRLTLPEINTYRQQIQGLAGEYLSYPVQIAGVSARWDGISPNIQFHQVNIPDPVSGRHIAGMNLLSIDIDIWASLYNYEITPKLITIDSLYLTLLKRRDGQMGVLNQFSDNPAGDTAADRGSVRNLLEHKNMSINDVKITVLDEHQQGQPMLFSGSNLRITNNGYQTRLSATITTPVPYRHELDVVLRSTGDLFTSGWSVTAYLAGKDINISPLLDKIPGLAIDEYRGVADIRLWATWGKNRFRTMQGEVKLKQAGFSGNNSEIYIDSSIMHFLATKKNPERSTLLIKAEELLTAGNSWPEFTVSIDKIYDGKHNKNKIAVYASHLNIPDTLSALNINPYLADKLSPLNKLQLTGDLKNSFMEYGGNLDGTKDWYFQSEFSQLGNTGKHDGDLKLAGLNGHITGTMDGGKLHVDSDELTIDMGGIFHEPLTFYGLNGSFGWRFRNGELLVGAHVAEAHADDFDLRLWGDLLFEPDSKQPLVNMLMEISNGRFDNIDGYIPQGITRQFDDWLRTSMMSMTVPAAKFIFRGRPEDYPFHHNEGVFRAEVNIKDGGLSYDPEWPSISVINGDLEIRNDYLTIKARSGKIFNAEIANASVDINNMATKGVETSLLATGTVHGTPADGLLFIKNSPLKREPTIQSLGLKDTAGHIHLDLDLDIPFSPRPISVDGKLAMSNAALTSNDTSIELSDINGMVKFTQDSIHAETIKAKYFNQPVKLDIENEDEKLTVKLSGTADKEFIGGQLAEYLPVSDSWRAKIQRHIDGACSWQASIISNNKKSRYDRQLFISSNLQGLAIDLPQPFTKPSKTALKPLALSINRSRQNEYLVNIQYPTSKKNNERRLDTELSIAIDDNPATDNTDNQFNITGKIGRLMVDKWFELLGNGQGGIRTTNSPGVISADIQIGSMHTLNQEFADVKLRLNNTGNDYHLNADAEKLRGDIYIEPSDDAGLVRANLERLSLSANTIDDQGHKSSYKLSPEAVPPLDIDIAEFSYAGINLGKLKLTTAKANNGIDINNISVNSKDIAIKGTGRWGFTGSKEYSSVSLEADTPSLDAGLKILNQHTAVIKGDQTKLKMDIQWPGTPVNFSLNNINGAMDIMIKNGLLANMQSPTNRLFGLLNLAALPRRLALDFSDLFDKDIFFNEIGGKFEIRDGNAHTNSFLMSGTSLNIDISGRIGLADKDYEQLLTVTPKVSDSLSLASALLGPVGITIGTFIFLTDKVSRDASFNNILSQRYTITGKWDNPQIAIAK